MQARYAGSRIVSVQPTFPDTAGQTITLHAELAVVGLVICNWHHVSWQRFDRNHVRDLGVPWLSETTYSNTPYCRKPLSGQARYIELARDCAAFRVQESSQLHPWRASGV